MARQPRKSKLAVLGDFDLDEPPDAHLERLVNEAVFALEDRLGVYAPYEADRRHFSTLSLSSQQVLTIIGSADRPLQGSTDKVQRDPSLVPIREKWEVTTEGHILSIRTLERLLQRRETRSQRCKYELDADGTLSTVDPATTGKVRRRSANDGSAVGLEDAFAYMAAALAAFGPLYLSLTKDAGSTVLSDLDKAVSGARLLARRLRHENLRILRPVGTEALAAIAEQFVFRAGKMRVWLSGQKKPNARRTMVGKLAIAFKQMFGKDATYDPNRPNTPFIEFAVAFFKETGCPYAPTSVGHELRQWQKSTRGVFAKKKNR